MFRAANTANTANTERTPTTGSRTRRFGSNQRRTYLSVLAASVGLACLAAPSMAQAEAKPRVLSVYEGLPPIAKVTGWLDDGWQMRVVVPIEFAAHEDDDKLLATLYRGRKQLEDLTCSTRAGQDGGTNRREVNDRSKDVPVRRFTCRSKEQKSYKFAGAMTVKYSYRSTDEEKTYKSIGQQTLVIVKGTTKYYLDPAHVVGPVFYAFDRPSSGSQNFKFTTYISTQHSHRNSVKNPVLRCKRDGKKIPKSGSASFSDDIISSKKDVTVYQVTFRARWMYTGFDAKAPLESFEDVHFGQMPGNYDCRITVDGETHRRFSFVVAPEKFLANRCTDALGFDQSSGVFAKSSALKDHAVKAKNIKKRLLYRASSIPKECKSII